MNALRLKNFRCFREEQEAVLAPLTLLVGENSTGKTSFMAAVRAVWDILYGLSGSFEEDPYDLGSFDDIAHYRGKRGGRAESFELGFDFEYQDTETQDRPRCRFDTIIGKRGVELSPLARRFSVPSTNAWMDVAIAQAEDKGLWRVRLGAAESVWEIDLGDAEQGDIYMPLFLVPPALDLERDRPHVFRDTQVRKTHGSEESFAADKRQVKYLQQILRQIVVRYRFGGDRPYASAAVRSKPQRTYDLSDVYRDPEGTYLPTYLWYLDAREEKDDWDKLKQSLEEFGKDSGLFDEIGIRKLGKLESEPFQLQIRKYGKSAKGPRRNIIDVGYGVSQALSVVAELLRYQATPIFLLQQPEVHLHPSAQAALGSLFCRIAGPARQLIVETHSDHMIDRIRMDVRDGASQLTPSDVSILFFERRNLGVRIHSLRLDDQGNVLDAPPSYRRFFMDEVHRSIGL